MRKYDGMVVTDWASATEMIAHGFFAKTETGGCHGYYAGVNMEMVSGAFIENLEVLVDEKKVSITTIDDAVRNILRLKFRLSH